MASQHCTDGSQLAVHGQLSSAWPISSAWLIKIASSPFSHSHVEGVERCVGAGAGMIFSQGLMRMRSFDDIELAVRSMNWRHQGAGGQLFNSHVQHVAHMLFFVHVAHFFAS